MAIDIRRRMSGENRRGDLRNLVRSRAVFRRQAVDDPITPITLKAFDADGNFLYEYWMANVFESHDGTLYGLEIREITPAWEHFEVFNISYGFGSYNFAQLSKTGTRPLGVTGGTLAACRQFALDAVSIDRVTGVKTMLHSAVDFVFAEYDPAADDAYPLVQVGLPEFASANATRFVQLYQVTDDGS